MIAAKTEFKTIASKIIQHPAVTIDRIKRRRVIDFPNHDWAGPPSPREAATPDRTGTHGQARERKRRAKTARLPDDRNSAARRNETRSLRLMPAPRVNSGTASPASILTIAPRLFEFASISSRRGWHRRNSRRASLRRCLTMELYDDRAVSFALAASSDRWLACSIATICRINPPATPRMYN